MIKIENGCTRSRTVPNRWLYEITLNSGIHRFEFDAQPDERPEIGDFISGPDPRVLIKRDGYQINQDHRMWKDRFADTRAYDKMDPPETW